MILDTDDCFENKVIVGIRLCYSHDGWRQGSVKHNRIHHHGKAIITP